MRRRGRLRSVRGAILVEALAAAVLVALAAAVVAAAASTAMRAVRRAAEIEHATVIAARELAARQTLGGGDDADEPLSEPVLAGARQRVHVAPAAGGSEVRVTIGHPDAPPLVSLATRVAAGDE